MGVLRKVIIMSNRKSIFIGTMVGFVGGVIAGKYGKQICSYVKNGVDRKPIEDMALEIKENMKKNKDGFCKTLENFSDNIFMKSGQKNEGIDNIHNFQYVKVTVPNKEEKVSNKECIENKTTEDVNQIISDILKEVDKKDEEKSVIVEKDELVLPKVPKEVEDKQLVDKEELVLPKVPRALKDELILPKKSKNELPLPKVPKELEGDRKYNNNTSSLKRRQNQKNKSKEIKIEGSSEEK